MDANTNMDQWLVRTSENWIAGPYPKDQICEMIRSGKLKAQDEVCSGSGYWIYLSETDLLKQFLGVELPKVKLHSSTEEEITEAGLPKGVLDLDEVSTDPHLQIQRSSAGELLSVGASSASISEKVRNRESSQVEWNGSSRMAQGQVKVHVEDELGIRPGAEDSSGQWTWLLVVSLVLGSVIAFVLLKILKH